MNSSGETTFFNCGGGLYIESANLTVIGCVFRDNVSRDIETILGIGAAVMVNIGGATVRNCTFSENVSVGALNAFRADSVVVEGCTFDSNVAVGDLDTVLPGLIFEANRLSRPGVMHWIHC